MNKPKRVLVYLANGVQGSAVVRQAMHHGYAVRALVRDAQKSDHLKALGVEIATSDLQDIASLEAAHEEIDYVVLQMPIGAPSHIENLMNNALEASKSSSVKGVVVKMASANPSIQTTEPGFVANQLIENKMQQSGIPFSIIRPTMYLDNFLKPSTRQGIVNSGVIVYPISASQKIAWTSVDDAARAAITLLETQSFNGDFYISGLDAVDGDALAATFSDVLNRCITFQSLPLGDFERAMDSLMGDGMGKRVSSKLRFFEEHPAEANWMLASTFKPSLELSTFLPTTMEMWVENHAALLSSA